MIPTTRKERYINQIVGGGDTAPVTPITEEEFFFSDILGEVNAPYPITNIEKYLAKIANKYSGELPEPITRIERFIARAAGMDIEIPTPITREEILWSNYSAIVDFEVEGVPPLTYKAIEGTLENYRIYGDTVDGESVGDRTGNFFDEKQQMTTGVITNSGAIDNTESSCEYSDFIEMLPNVDYTIRATYSTQKYIRVVFYDSSKNFIERALSTSITPTITFNKNANYIRICVDKKWSTIMLNSGSTALPYEPYGYKVPVTVEGKNLLDINSPNVIPGHYYDDTGIWRVNPNHSISDYIPCVANTMYTLSFYAPATLSGPFSIYIHFWDELKNYITLLETAYIVTKGMTYELSFTAPQNGFIRFNFLHNSGYTDKEMFNIGTTPIPYEPYHTPITTPIYLPEQIKKVGDEAEYISYSDQKLHRIGADDIDVTLPALPTLTGTNVLSVGTAVQPSKVYVKYKGERQ